MAVIWIRRTGKSNRIRYDPVQGQRFGSNCGPFAIVNVYCVLSGISTATASYSPEVIRQWIISCFDKHALQELPKRGQDRPCERAQRQGFYFVTQQDAEAPALQFAAL